MKPILTALLSIFSYSLFSQVSFGGKFCSTSLGEGNVTCIHFKENNQFEYQVSGCLGVSHVGSGKYNLRDSTLILHFKKQEQSIKSKVEITEKPKLSELPAKFHFKIFDLNGDFISPIWIKRESDNKYFTQNEGSDGVIIEGNLTNEEFTISFIGLETVDIKLDSKTDKLIKIYLAEAQPLVISNKIMKYKLSKMTPYSFSVADNILDRFKLVEY